MEKKSRCLITVLTWNRRKITKKTLSSLKNHNPDVMRDIVIIDNGSTDGSPDYFEDRGYDVVRNRKNTGIFHASRRIWLEAIDRGYDFILNLQNDFPCVATIPFDDIESYMDQNEDVGFVRLNEKKKKKSRYVNYLTGKRIKLEPWQRVGKTDFAKHNHHCSFNPNYFRASIMDFIVNPVVKTRERQIMERFESLRNQKNIKSAKIKDPCPCFDTVIRSRQDGWKH